MKDQKDEAPHDMKGELEIRESDNTKNIETQYSGRIDNLNKITFDREGRNFLTKSLTITVCILLAVVIPWGMITGDWEGWKNTSGLTTWILGFLLGHYYQGT